MADVAVLTAGALLGLTGIGALRFGWGQVKRSVILNTAGWASIGSGLAAGWAYAGAWGTSVALLWIMGGALVLQAIAAFRDPAGQAKGSNRRAGMLPERGEPRDMARRIATFVIVVAGGLATAIAIGMITRRAALLGNASEADANVLAFFAVPLVWSILAFLLLMTPDRKRQLAIIGLPMVAAIPAILEGSMP